MRKKIEEYKLVSDHTFLGGNGQILIAYSGWSMGTSTPNLENFVRWGIVCFMSFNAKNLQ